MCRRRGEAVTISYGDWPTDVFFLVWGFLPPAGRHADTALLFADLTEMVAFFDSLQVWLLPGDEQRSHLLMADILCVRMCYLPYTLQDPRGMLPSRSCHAEWLVPMQSCLRGSSRLSSQECMQQMHAALDVRALCNCHSTKSVSMALSSQALGALWQSAGAVQACCFPQVADGPEPLGSGEPVARWGTEPPASERAKLLVRVLEEAVGSRDDADGNDEENGGSDDGNDDGRQGQWLRCKTGSALRLQAPCGTALLCTVAHSRHTLLPCRVGHARPPRISDILLTAAALLAAGYW